MVWSQLHHIRQGPSSPRPGIFTVFQHIHTQIYTHHITCTCIHVWIQKNMCTCGYILWAMHMCTCNILQAHVHVRIYIFNAPEADSAYMYTCKDIYYGLSFTT